MQPKHAVVIGAGIVGTSSAIWLRRAGLEVTLIDRGAPGDGTSFGNACVLASCGVGPVTGPGLIAKSPKYLMDPNYPLFLRWRYLPKLAPFLVKYLSNANEAVTRRISAGIAGIVSDSLEQHQALTRGTIAAKWVQPSDYMFVYKDRAAYEGEAFSWSLRRAAGFEPEIIEGAAVQEREPILSPEMTLLAVMKDHGFIHNPGNYVKDLVKVLEAEGGKFRQATVKDFDLSGGKISAIETDQGRIPCDQAVLAAGVWSRPLMLKLGLDVPLEAERGYHVVFKGPSITPTAPMMLTDGKFVATPMDQGVRCAGIVEFGGLSPDKSKAPLKLLRKQVARSFPTLEWEAEDEWLGYRPAPSDSIPLVGQVAQTGVYTAFGHHHIGLTGGPKTGRLVAGMIAGQPTNTDMRPYDPERFRAR